MRDHRRLAAIVSADVVGYSRLMGRDESGTLETLKAHRRELIDPKIAEYGGRIVKTTGDGLLLEFPSVVDALRCAVDVQRSMAERNASVPADQRIEFRIGINVGDIIIDGDDIFGDGVNVAARLQMLAEPGGICASRVVRDQVLDKLSFAFEDLGPQDVKNIARPVEVYRVDLGSGAPPTQSLGRKRWQRLTRAVGWRWLAAGVLALGLAGIAVWALPQLWKTAPAPTPPPLSVAILPFAAPAGSPAEEQFADALTQDLTMAIGRTRAMQVVSRSAAATYRGKAIDARVIGRELNVRYIVEGEVRRVGELIAVNAQLIDTGKATQAWSGRLELEEARVAQDQGSLVTRLTRRLYEALWNAEIARADKLPANASAVDYTLRAVNVWARDPTSLQATLQGRKLFDQALRLDPNLVRALTGKAQTLTDELNLDPHADHDGLVRQIEDLTLRAVGIDDQDPGAWTRRARALAWQWRWEAALEANARALRLDPSRDGAFSERAELMLLMGRPTEALPLADQALALEPSNASAVGRPLSIRCHAYLNLGRYDEAISACEKSAALDDWWMTHVYLIAAYTQRDETAKADAEKAKLLKERSGFSIADLKALRLSNDPTYLQQTETHLYAGLRKAGIPER